MYLHENILLCVDCSTCLFCCGISRDYPTHWVNMLWECASITVMTYHNRFHNSLVVYTIVKCGGSYNKKANQPIHNRDILPVTAYQLIFREIQAAIRFECGRVVEIFVRTSGKSKVHVFRDILASYSIGWKYNAFFGFPICCRTVSGPIIFRV